MTNEVPLDVGRELASFLSDLIDVVLSKMSLSSIVCCLQIFHWLCLTHCQEDAVISQSANFLSKFP